MGLALQKAIIYAVHGFFGCAADWDALKNSIPDFNFVAEDLFSHQPKIGTSSFANANRKKIFLGYSLGGRLGLRLLSENPKQFDHYIFLSTHPGLSDQQSKNLRIESDEKWADKINYENWPELQKSWNAQPVFAGSGSEPVRDVARYDLKKLKLALGEWSLGRQNDYSELIREHNQKITWVVGERDSKFCAIASDLENKKILSGYERISSGHRIWLDQPIAIANIIKKITQ